MHRPTLTVSAELYEAVRQYQRAGGFSSWAQAAIALIRAGLLAETSHAPTDNAPSWGGKRR